MLSFRKFPEGFPNSKVAQETSHKRPALHRPKVWNKSRLQLQHVLREKNIQWLFSICLAVRELIWPRGIHLFLALAGMELLLSWGRRVGRTFHYCGSGVFPVEDEFDPLGKMKHSDVSIRGIVTHLRTILLSCFFQASSDFVRNCFGMFGVYSVYP